MIKEADFDGENLSLILVTDNDDVFVVTGKIKVDEEGLLFEHGGEPSSFPSTGRCI